MTSAEFHTILEKPHLVAEANIDELRELAQKYSYSQIFQLLYAMRLRYSSEHLFDRQLAKTSVLTSDRQVLFQMFKEGNYPVEGYEKTEEEPVKELEALNTTAQPEDALEVVSELPEAEEKELTDTTSSQVLKKEEDIKQQPQEESQAVKKDTEAGPLEKEATAKERILQNQSAPAEKEEKKELSVNEKVAAILAKNRALKNELDQIKKNKAAGQVPKSESTTSGEVQESLQAQAVSPKVASAEEPKDREPMPPAKKEEITPAKSAETPKESLQEGSAAKETRSQEDELAATIFMGAVEWEAVETSSIDTTEEGEESEAVEEEYLEIEALAAQHQKESESIILVDEVQQVKAYDATEKQKEKAENNENFTEEEAQEVSFSRWLKQISQPGNIPTKAEAVSNKLAREPSTETDNLEFEQKMQLLDSFVEKLPDLKKRREPAAEPAKRQFNNQDPSLVTETLAKVYLRQKHYKKAIKAYEILKLKYPEKSSFFASQILEIKNLANS